MTPKLWIPVYHDTADQRIIKWVNEQFTTHDLATTTTITKASTINWQPKPASFWNPIKWARRVING